MIDKFLSHLLRRGCRDQGGSETSGRNHPDDFEFRVSVTEIEYSNALNDLSMPE
jgi:hypothetical protein